MGRVKTVRTKIQASKDPYAPEGRIVGIRRYPFGWCVPEQGVEMVVETDMYFVDNTGYEE